MKRKPVPRPPDNLDAIDDYRSAVPLVPGSEDDCCTRLMERAGAPDRSTAGEWLEFLCALGLARETKSGFVRTRDDLDRSDLAENFLNRIVLAEDVIDVLAAASDPVDTESVFDEVRDRVPRWEQRKRDDWQAVWRERTDRLLDWAVLLGLASRIDGGYRRQP